MRNHRCDHLTIAWEFALRGDLVVFIAGMLCVLVGIVFAGLEVHRSFKIVLIEVNAEE